MSTRYWWHLFQRSRPLTDEECRAILPHARAALDALLGEHPEVREAFTCTICDTPGRCACSGSGEECCCSFAAGPTCAACGARGVVIDFETGEPVDWRTS